MRSTHPLVTLALVLGVAAGAGCAAAVAGAAGAAAAVHLSDRGAETLVTANVEKTEEATRKVFAELGITETKARTETSSGTDKRVLDGASSDREITVTITAEGDQSKVEVVARKSDVTWDKDYARTIIQRIVAMAD